MAESPMDVFPNETHILGDSAYPFLPHLLTPYRDTGRLTASQANFNFIHSSTRNVVERAFGCMKNTNTLFFRTMKITMFVLGHLVRM